MAVKHKQLKVSLGLLVGYSFAAFLNVIFFDKSFTEAIRDRKLLFLFSGILVSAWIINRQKKKGR